MPTIKDFAPLYDWSQIEAGVQAFFVNYSDFAKPPDDNDPNRENWISPAGKTPFMTAFQAAVFTKCNPRVSCSLNGIVPFSNPPPMIQDANNKLRCRAWAAQLDFTVITPASYSQHTQLRSLVQAVVSVMVTDATTLLAQTNTGLNSILVYHEVGMILDAGNSTGIHIDKAFYASNLKYAITFAVRASAWPGGFNNS